MKLALEPPFCNLWDKGYLSINNKGRKIVSLYRSANDRRTISYARYLMSVKVGYVIPEELEVDHIDDDKTNDEIENLQILTKEENIAKNNKRREKEKEINRASFKPLQRLCIQCLKQYSLSYEQEVSKRKNDRFRKIEQGLSFCSQSCNASYYYKNNSFFLNNKSKNDKTKRRESFRETVFDLSNKGLSRRKIAERTGLTRYAVDVLLNN